MSETSNTRPQILEIVRETPDDGGVCLRVKMGRQIGARLNQTFLGDAESDGTPAGDRDSVARATLKALARAYALDDETLVLLDIKTVASFDRPAVLVAVLVRRDVGQQRLVGFCEVMRDEVDATARAVCNGLNRFLGLLK